MLRERVIVLLDPTVRRLDVGCLERWLADDQCINDDSKRPNVNLIGVSVAALEHLGSNVVRRAANCPLFLTVEVEFSSQAEVTKLDLHLVIQEQVAQFQVSVDYAMRVQVLESADYLDSVALHFKFMKPFAAL